MNLLVQLSLPAVDHTDPQYRLVEGGQKDWKFTSERPDGELYYRTTLQGSLSVTGADFAWLNAQYEKFPCCVEVGCNVLSPDCETDETPLFWPGYFIMQSVKWDFNTCTATVAEILPKDAYDALFRVWQNPVNVFKNAIARTPFIAVYPDYYTYQPNADGDLERMLPDGNAQGGGPSSQEHAYGQGVEMHLFLTTLLTLTTVGSSAAAINAVNSSFYFDPVNPVTGKLNLTKVILQGSDAKRPASQTLAVKFTTNLKDFLADLKALHNVYYLIDPDTGALVLEHYRYFAQRDYVDTGKVTLNLTKFPDPLKLANNESVDVDNLFGVEELVIANNNASLVGEFKYGSIRYDDTCVPKDDKGQTKTNTLTCEHIWTDLMVGYQSPDSVPDDSIFLCDVKPPHSDPTLNEPYHILARDTEYHVYQDNIITATGLGNNGFQSAARLVLDFHRDGGSFTSGLVNAVKQADGSYSDGIRTGLYSTRMTRKQENIVIPLCCADMPVNLDGYAKTNRFDKGKLDKGVYDPAAETFTMTIMANSRCENAAVVVAPPDPGSDCAPHGTPIDTRREVAYCSDGVTEMSSVIIYTYADGDCGTYEVPGVSGGNGGC